MDCPKCGHVQVGEQECERCGVIFARLQKKEEDKALPSEAEMEPSVLPRKASSGLAGWLVALAVGLSAGWYVFAPPQPQPAPETGPPAAVSSPESVQEGRNPQPAMSQPGMVDQPQTAEGLAGKLAAAFPAGNPLEQARNATVFIKTPWGSGSGFFVTANGYIITNRHVVEFDAAQLKDFKGKADKLAAELERDRRNREVLQNQLATLRDPGVRRQVEEELQRRQEAHEKYSAMHKEITGQLQRIERSSWSADIKVVLIDGSELAVQSLKMSDRTDLALLSVDCYNAPFIQPVTDNRHLGQGQKVYSIGSPMGLRHTVTGGIISGYREHKGRKFIQTDAPINPGNSGGPLIDEQGGLIGINTMVLRDAQGIGFAVPFQEVKTEFGQYLGGDVKQLADGRIRFLLGGKEVRGVLVRGTGLVNEMRTRHGLGLLETLVLGHACLAATLLATTLKGDKDRLALRIECSGPIKGLVAEANGAGEVRGYLRQNPIPLEKPLESFDLAPFFGAGFLSVSTHLEGASQPFTGTIMLEHGNLALDLSHYFQTSEQTPTAIVLSIQFNSEGLPVGAGGLLLQAMPGVEPGLMGELEECLSGLPSLGRYFAEEGDAEGLLAKEFAAFQPEILTTTPVAFACPCSREEISARLLTLSAKDLEELRSGPFPVEACCHYCNTTYLFDRQDMEKLWQERAGRG